MRYPQGHKGRKGVAVMTAILFLFTSCSLGRQGTLDPGGLPGEGSFVVSVPRPADGRDVAFTMSTLVNNSTTDEITFTSIDLVGGNGLELVDVFTVDDDHQIPVGMPVPPQADDGNGDPASGLDPVANWETRTPLIHSVVPPEQQLRLVIVLQPTSSDDCLSVRGYSITYREHGRSYAVTSNAGMVVFNGDSDDGQCDDVEDEILNNPIAK